MPDETQNIEMENLVGDENNFLHTNPPATTAIFSSIKKGAVNIRHDARILAQTLKKHFIPDPSMLEKQLFDLENEIKKLTENALEELQNALTAISEKEKSIEGKLGELIQTILITSKPLSEEEINLFLEKSDEKEDTISADGKAQAFAVVTAFYTQLKNTSVYCSPTYFIDLPDGVKCQLTLPPATTSFAD